MENLIKTTKYVPPAVLAFFPAKHKIEIDLWTSLRNLAKDYPPLVQKRLEWIIFYETIAKKDAELDTVFCHPNPLCWILI